MNTETYVNINEQCDAIDELCVICLEIEDDFKNRTILHSKFFNSQCECHYYIHKHCFEKWLEKRPTKNIACLICSSKANLVLSRKERCIKIVNSSEMKINCKKICRLIQWLVCLSFLWVLLREINNVKNNNDE